MFLMRSWLLEWMTWRCCLGRSQPINGAMSWRLRAGAWCCFWLRLGVGLWCRITSVQFMFSKGKKMVRLDRILKRLSSAIDRALVSKTPTHLDVWCCRWSRAYRREVAHVVSHE